MAELEGRFVDQGSRDLLPVLLLHAYPYNSTMWAGQTRALEGRARVLTLDARGLSPALTPPPAYLLEHLVDDVLALLDRQQVASCVVAGLSLGGYVALRLVQRAPERVRGLLLADTQAGSDGNEAKLARAEALRLLWTRGKEAFAEAQLKRQLSPATWSGRPELVASLKAMIVQASPEGLSACMVAIATRNDLSTFLPEIRVPTTLLVGEHDVITPPATAASMAAAIQGAELQVLAGAGHLANLEAESAFNARLLALLDRVRN